MPPVTGAGVWHLSPANSSQCNWCCRKISRGREFSCVENQEVGVYKGMLICLFYSVIGWQAIILGVSDGSWRGEKMLMLNQLLGKITKFLPSTLPYSILDFGKSAKGGGADCRNGCKIQFPSNHIFLPSFFYSKQLVLRSIKIPMNVKWVSNSQWAKS